MKKIKFFLLMLLALPWIMIWSGFESIWPVRSEPLWPLVALVSVPQELDVDIYSSVPNLVSIFFAFVQCWILVEIARYYNKRFEVVRGKSILLFPFYEASLFLDWFRIWSPDWYSWALYRINISRELVARDYDYSLVNGGSPPYTSIAFFALMVVSFLISPDPSFNTNDNKNMQIPSGPS